MEGMCMTWETLEYINPPFSYFALYFISWFDSQLKSRIKGRGVDFNVLQNLEQAEKNGDGENGQKKEGEEGSDMEEEEEENAEDLDVDDDYMVDHYASDGDNDDYGGDDDREAVF